MEKPMTNTCNLNIPLVAQNQAQKEVTVNEALCVIDAILNRGAIHKGANTPPASQASGDLYIIGTVPTGAWNGRANNIAYYNTIWKFITPNEGMTIWVNDEDLQYSWDGAGWVQTISKAMNNLAGIGVNTSYDSINKLAVKSDAVLFDNNGADSRVKVNKHASGDTASHLFQNNYSGRAEFGLVGDDNFQLKVSADGSVWKQSFVVDKASGNIDFKQAINLSGDVACNGRLLVRPELKDYVETLTIANSGTAYNINLQNGNLFEITRTGNCTITFSNPPASGKGRKFTLILKQDPIGGRTITWPVSVKWPGGIAPTLTLTTNAVDIITFQTTDGGVRWYGMVDGINMR